MPAFHPFCEPRLNFRTILNPRITMKTTFRIFASALFCFALSLLVGFTSQAEEKAQPEKKAGDRMVLTIKNVEYPFRWCPPGTFMMGSPENEQGRQYSEKQHQVTLTQGFWLLETPVTQEMWTSVTGYNPSMYPVVLGYSKKQPVEQVSWNECRDYITQLNNLSVAPAGFKFAFPTESQWEYACRAGTTTAYHFGDTLDEKKANFGMNVKKGPTEVGSYPANAWGFFDMHGNVEEWCWDWNAEYPDGNVTDPTGPLREPLPGWSRIQRGGAYNLDAKYVRSAYRGYCSPQGRGLAPFGLRLALVRAE